MFLVSNLIQSGLNLLNLTFLRRKSCVKFVWVCFEILIDWNKTSSAITKIISRACWANFQRKQVSKDNDTASEFTSVKFKSSFPKHRLKVLMKQRLTQPVSQVGFDITTRMTRHIWRHIFLPCHYHKAFLQQLADISFHTFSLHQFDTTDSCTNLPAT